MIPLSIFLIPWAVFILLFLVLSLLSMMQMLRFGMAGSMVYTSTAIFIIVSALAVFVTVSYFLAVDWPSLAMNVGGFTQPEFVTF